MANRARRDQRPLLAAALAAALLVAGLGGAQRLGLIGCSSILVASSQEKAELMATLASEYSRLHPDLLACGQAVNSEAVPSGIAEARLAAGWTGADRPDVWAPQASTWVLLLGARQPDLLPETELQSIATSPLVVAMPRPMAVAMGWPGRQPSWRDLLLLADDPRGWGRFGHPEWGQFRFGKTDPGTSTSGLHTLVAAYYAATGKSSDLSDADVRAPATIAFVKGVEESVSHYADTAGTFLTDLATADDTGNSLSYMSAVTVEEQEMWSYNRGAYESHRLPPRVPLVAVYPADGTLMADHPYLVLQAPWVDAGRRRLAADFLSWLQEPQQQARFARLGFRDYRGNAGPILSADAGVAAGEPTLVLRSPAPAIVAQIQASWASIRKPANLLIVLDLADPASGKVVAEALKGLSSADAIRIWSAAGPGQSQPYSTLLPQTPVGSGQAAILAAVGAAPAHSGRSQLYAATTAAYRLLAATPDPDRVNAVLVIAGGVDAGGGPSLETLKSEVRPAPGGPSLRVYAVAFPGADAGALSDLARTSGGYFSQGDPASAIRKALAEF